MIPKSDWRTILLILSAVACLFLTFGYGSRCDICTAITVFPVWIWPFPGLFFVALAWRGGAAPKYKAAVAVVALIWLAYAAAFSEELKSMGRTFVVSEKNE